MKGLGKFIHKAYQGMWLRLEVCVLTGTRMEQKVRLLSCGHKKSVGKDKVWQVHSNKRKRKNNLGHLNNLGLGHTHFGLKIRIQILLEGRPFHSNVNVMLHFLHLWCI